jgi:hypothetical protein
VMSAANVVRSMPIASSTSSRMRSRGPRGHLIPLRHSWPSRGSARQGAPSFQ